MGSATSAESGPVVVVGVDVAKGEGVAASWDAARGRAAELGAFANAPAGWEALAAAPAAAPGGAVRLVLEPTGGDELGLALWAHARGWRVHRPNPRQVREWAAGEGRRARTDRQDARLLAAYGAAHAQAPAWPPLPDEVEELDQLRRRRDDVAGLLHQERRRQEQAAARPRTPAAVPASVGRVVAALEPELAALEREIAEHLGRHAPLERARHLLLSLPGVGARNVRPLLVLLHRWAALTEGKGTAKGLTAFAGLDPRPYESGTSVRRRATISRQGDRGLRARLSMGALGAWRGHNPAHDFSDRLVARGKAKKLALVATTRQVLTWAWAVFLADAPFDPARFAA
jgi:transposase